jgi:hypothetical protein
MALAILSNVITGNQVSGSKFPAGEVLFGPATGYDARVFNNIIDDNFS